MSRVSIRQQLGLDTSGLTLSSREQQLYEPIGRAIGGVDNMLALLLKQTNQEIELGYPDDGASINGGTSTPQLQNINGAWASALVTGSLGSAVTFTHNLGVAQKVLATPTLVPTRLYSLANVRWLLVNFTHGDRAGANAGPAAAANPAHSSVYFRLGDTVTANAIQLRVHSDLTVSATEPLLVEIFFTPAVI